MKFSYILFYLFRIAILFDTDTFDDGFNLSERWRQCSEERDKRRKNFLMMQ